MKKQLSKLKIFSVREQKKEIRNLEKEIQELEFRNSALANELKYLQSVEARHEVMIQQLNELQKTNENCLNSVNERVQQ